ncbi:glycoside hydrolase [Candidatus Epulonipiscium fishelsonii]|uniref:Glycoside hydrolase n=1 Tax=Candidatus Epulonipiscium fishelsonii TaxID=77094 RepID=A0ACC8XGD2_9FIRM|nr:glycoside hydrolase [Epulopiscium sp. SCG-B05WGA-EpuloA1]ONI42495.1 glycoside hydrolase [Epulopiscium sp. SCG-B11WGA-EpuloA1]
MKRNLFITMVCLVVISPVCEARIFPESIGVEGKINTEVVNMRSYPSLDAEIVKLLENDKIHILGRSDEWYKVQLDNTTGWIYQDYIQINEDIPHVVAKGNEIVEYGMDFIGTPYVWGGNNLQKGVDCSGFTQQLFDTFDFEISRVSYNQANDGNLVHKSELKSGDLVFFDTSGTNNGNISHVGIYINEGQFLHADGTNGVMVSDLDNPYYSRNYVKSVRIIQ